MGQKVHPVGFRLGVSQPHKSLWFKNKFDYVSYLKEDFIIRQSIEKKMKDGALSKIIIHRAPDQVEVFLHTAKPGLLFGRGSDSLSKIKSAVKQIGSKATVVRINVIEVKNPEADAQLIAQSIAQQLSKRVAFRKAVRQSLTKVPFTLVKGVKIQVSGRLNGAEIARVEWLREGRVPLQTIRADIDYASVESHTMYGVLGVKVWVFRDLISTKTFGSSAVVHE
jgi:small subunit ribosomal protein S3